MSKKKAKKRPGKVARKTASKHAQYVRFINEYLANGCNGGAAYKKLHPRITDRSADVLGSKLLANIDVSKLLAERQAELAKKYALTADDAIRSLSQAIHFDPRKLYNADGTLKSITGLDDDTAMALAGVDVVEMHVEGEDIPMYTKKIKWLDKNTAREQAMKHLGLFEKDNDQFANAVARIFKIPAKKHGSG